MTIEHQLINSPIRFPTWDVDKLFLGTFNPSCGKQLDYYYRRPRNGFWKILKYYDRNNNYNFNDLLELQNFMTEKRFGCIDVIEKVEFPEKKKELICGKGYEDSVLFTVKGFIRTYVFQEIKDMIIQNNIRNVFSTWGNRNSPREFKMLLTDFNNFCIQNEVNFLPLESPSGRLYKGESITRINNSWRTILNPLFQ